MSVDLMVYLRREKLPTRDSWQQAIDAQGIELKLDDADTITHTGYWPAKLNGKECGFEYSFDKAEPLDVAETVDVVEPRGRTDSGWWVRLFGTAPPPVLEYHDQEDELQQVLADRDYAVTFTTHASDDEAEAASLAGVVLAKIADGVFFDPQSGDWAVGEGAFRLLEDQESERRERLMEVAIKKWSRFTKSRCPKCNAPCPEFRPKCYVCDYEIGRA
jgi:hypothetical protein